MLFFNDYTVDIYIYSIVMVHLWSGYAQGHSGSPLNSTEVAWMKFLVYRRDLGWKKTVFFWGLMQSCGAVALWDEASSILMS